MLTNLKDENETKGHDAEAGSVKVASIQVQFTGIFVLWQTNPEGKYG